MVFVQMWRRTLWATNEDELSDARERPASRIVKSKSITAAP